jgi:hypothetical protein
MALVEINRNPSPRELCVFGVLLAAFVVVLGALLRFRWGLPTAGSAVWAAGAVVVAVYAWLPAVRRPLHVGWMLAVRPIGTAVSLVLLGMVYYAVLTPVGLLLRLSGRDAMRRALDRTATTYWSPHRPPSGVARYFRQF